MAGQGDVAPGGAGAPEVAAGAGAEGEDAFHGGVVEAGPREEHVPGGEGAAVVMAAFGFAEGVAAAAVVAGADGGDDAEGIVRHAFLDTGDGGGVFEAGHHLGEIREGHAEAAARPRRHDEAGLVAEGVGTHGVEVVGEAGAPIVLHHTHDGAAEVAGVGEGAEAGEGGGGLAHQLIHEAAGAELEGWVGGRVGSEARGEIGGAGREDVVFVVVAVEEMGVDPGGAAGSEGVALFGERGVGHGAGESGSGAEGGEIPEGHLGVGAVVVHVHGVVLRAFEDAVLVGVPAAGGPGVGEGGAHAGPVFFEEGAVAGELPVAVEFDDAAELAVGGGVGAAAGAGGEGEADAEGHATGVVGGVGELGVAHIAGEFAEEMGGGLLVVPDVGAVAVAGTVGVHDALPGEEFAGGVAEDGLRAEGGEVEEGGFLERGGGVGGEEGFDKTQGGGFEGGQARDEGLGGGPGVGVERGVVVADGVFAVAEFVGEPGAAVGEVPDEGEGEDARFAGGELVADAEGG